MIESTLPILAGAVLSAALIGSALLGWLGDLKRVGASTSARETTRRATSRDTTRPRPKSRMYASAGAASRPAEPQRSAAREQEERIRDAYFAKERKAREERERRRREQARTRRTRPSSTSTGHQTPPPPSVGSEESRHRATLDLTGPITKDSVRAAYRRLIAAYHPDRCATLGLKLRTLAEEETKRINEAYSFFRRMLK